MLTRASPTMEIYWEHKRGKRILGQGNQSLMFLKVAKMSDGTKVSVELRKTKNLGNYENLTVGVTVTIPTTSDNTDESIEKAKDIANNQMTKIFTELTSL